MSGELFGQLEEPPGAPEMTLLGMALFYDDDEPVGVPLSGFAIVKTMAEGEINYRVLSTEGLGTVECLGMLRWAQLMVEAGMIEATEESSED